MGLSTGRLNQRVTIQSVTLAKDQYHEQAETWTDVATVPASVNPVAAVEQVTADRLETQQRLIITIRYRSDVTVKNRLEHVLRNNTRYYKIVSVVDRDMRQRVLDLVCTYEQDNLV